MYLKSHYKILVKVYENKRLTGFKGLNFIQLHIWADSHGNHCFGPEFQKLMESENRFTAPIFHCNSGAHIDIHLARKICNKINEIEGRGKRQCHVLILG